MTILLLGCAVLIVYLAWHLGFHTGYSVAMREAIEIIKTGFIEIAENPPLDFPILEDACKGTIIRLRNGYLSKVIGIYYVDGKKHYTYLIKGGCNGTPVQGNLGMYQEHDVVEVIGDILHRINKYKRK